MTAPRTYGLRGKKHPTFRHKAWEVQRGQLWHGADYNERNRALECFSFFAFESTQHGMRMRLHTSRLVRKTAVEPQEDAHHLGTKELHLQVGVDPAIYGLHRTRAGALDGIITQLGEELRIATYLHNAAKAMRKDCLEDMLVIKVDKEVEDGQD